LPKPAQISDSKKLYQQYQLLVDGGEDGKPRDKIIFNDFN
jgi:hypothetical protein